MKNRVFKTIYGAILLVASISAAACSSDSGDDAPFKGSVAMTSSSEGVTVSQGGSEAEVVLDPLGSSVSLTIDASEEWELLVDEGDGWCAVNGTGNEIVVSAREFVSDYTRSTMVRIAVEDRVIGFIHISQSGTDVATLSLDHAEVVFNEIGGEIVVAVDTNKSEWTVTGYEDASWLDVETGDGTFTLIADTNEVAYEFNATLTITAGTADNKKSVDLEVTLSKWSPAQIRLDREFIAIPEEGGRMSLAVETNREWEVVTNGDDWLDITREGDNLIISAASTTGGVKEATIHLQTTSGRDEASFDAEIKQFTDPFVLEYTISGNGGYVGVPLFGTVNCYIDWGDGTTSNFAGELNNYNHLGHQYETGGKFNVKMYGTATHIYGFQMPGSMSLTRIVEWGDMGATSFYYAFFATSISSIPDGYGDIFKKVTDPAGFNFMFRGCELLTTIPADLFNDIPSATSFMATFWGCTSLREIPGTLFDGSVGVTGIESLFRECLSLEEIPLGLFDPMENLSSAVTVFDGCVSLTEVPGHLFASNPKLSNLYGAFRGCEALESIDPDFLDGNRKLTDVGSLFSGCTSLTGSSPYSAIGDTQVHLYERADHSSDFSVPTGTKVFLGCTKLSDYASIPAEWK